MALIKVEHLTFGYNNENIFEDVNLNIDTNWKLGFTGRNGRGKTTFMNLLLGKYEYSGKIISDIEFEYFPYEVSEKSDLVINIAKSICCDIQDWQLNKEFAQLSLNEDTLYRVFNTLSNGEQTKVLLAILFLKGNKFLLIDEPTNYLDLEARFIVSEYLKKKKGFILISHDRLFLDNTVEYILAINKSNIEIQKGNFSSWYLNKKQQDNYEISSNIKLKKEIKRLSSASKQKENWSDKVERSKYRTTNSGGSLDKGYIGHKSAKMMKLAKNIENRRDNLIDEKRSLLKNIEESEDLKMFPIAYHSNKLLEFENVSISYDGKVICNKISFSVYNKDRILISGKNGSGKSSILKLVLGLNNNYEGNIIKNPNLKISYIEQNTDNLQGTLKEYIINNNINEVLFKTILRKLDLKANDFDTKINEYSQGMKKKILIAKSLCEEANLYIWDEPLNYIDVISRIQIENVILEYKPTMIFVEHDKSFCEKIATKTIAL